MNDASGTLGLNSPLGWRSLALFIFSSLDVSDDADERSSYI